MATFWANLDIIRTILTVSTTIPFLLFATAGIWHFGSGVKSGTNIVSLASLIGFISVLYSVWTQAIAPWSVLGIALQSFSVFLFGWCIGTSGRRNLSLAGADSRSTRLLTEGPYTLVRHPFYTSYILFWVGGIALACSVFTIASTALLIAIYFYTARGEDRVLAQRFADEFTQWQQKTGAFFPRLR